MNPYNPKKGNATLAILIIIFGAVLLYLILKLAAG